ncbi:HNH endonuclease signature motif containing protein [Gulosibacter sediminis]|uniref:HNH endonuclease signature motif containing protein n=1 Tax=Gulosibacter sediminis TaxID=1729695 RepID=UPI0024AD9F3C|nr:HNH endonuclease signature motif containing protein [Gulosibacter sediminis]
MTPISSTRHRPDGTTPDPEYDDLTERTRRFTTGYLDYNQQRRHADVGEIRMLAVAYDIAAEHTRRDTTAGAHLISDEHHLHSHLRSIVGTAGIRTNDSDLTLANRARDAHRLTTTFPAWMTALDDATVTLRHATALLRYANKVNDDRRDDYGTKVLDYAATHTPGQTDTYAKKLAARLNAADFETAFERAYEDRAVTIQDLDDGMSILSATIPTVAARAGYDLLSKQATQLRDDHHHDAKAHRARVREAQAAGEELSPEDAAFIDDPRTVAQLRADVFIETLLTSTPQSILESVAKGKPSVQATVSIIVPITTLLDPDAPRDIATIDGMEPISAFEARQIAGTVTCFDRILTDPITGHVLTVDTRTATPQMRKFLQARDHTCRFPGCRRPAHRSDLDHTVPWAAGGATSVDNQAHLCRRHHTQKHQHPWRVRHHGGGVLEWTSPTSDVFITRPEPPGPIFKPTDGLAYDPAVDPAPF